MGYLQSKPCWFLFSQFGLFACNGTLLNSTRFKKFNDHMILSRYLQSNLLITDPIKKFPNLCVIYLKRMNNNKITVLDMVRYFFNVIF